MTKDTIDLASERLAFFLAKRCVGKDDDAQRSTSLYIFKCNFADSCNGS